VVLSPGEVKWPGLESDHLPPSSVKNGGAIPPLPHMSSWHGAYQLNTATSFYFTRGASVKFVGHNSNVRRLTFNGPHGVMFQTKSDMPGYNGSLIVAMKTKDKDIFTAMFLLSILKKTVL
jgi:hypothetical protein